MEGDEYSPPPYMGYHGIRSASGRYASYCNVFFFYRNVTQWLQCYTKATSTECSETQNRKNAIYVMTAQYHLVHSMADAAKCQGQDFQKYTAKYSGKHRKLNLYPVVILHFGQYHFLKACLHVPSPCPCPLLSMFNIVSMETDCLMGRFGTDPFFPSNGPSSFTQCKFDRDEHGHGDGTCKQAFRLCD